MRDTGVTPQMSQALADRLRAGATARSRPFYRRGKFQLLGLVVLIGIGGLIYMGVKSAGMYYMTAAELHAKGEAAYTETVRIGGQVREDSVQQDEASNTLRFVVQDKNAPDHSINVVYRGVVPDAFKPGNEVVIDGRLGRDNTFTATNLLAKCPSKYKIPGT